MPFKGRVQALFSPNEFTLATAKYRSRPQKDISVCVDQLHTNCSLPYYTITNPTTWSCNHTEQVSHLWRPISCELSSVRNFGRLDSRTSPVFWGHRDSSEAKPVGGSVPMAVNLVRTQSLTATPLLEMPLLRCQSQKRLFTFLEEIVHSVWYFLLNSVELLPTEKVGILMEERGRGGKGNF